MRSTFFLSAIAVLTAFSGISFAQADAFIEKGDLLHAVFDNQGALGMYQAAMAYDPGNPEILWRLSRTCVDIGEHIEGDEAEEYFQRALGYADSAIAIAPDNPQGHLRRAIALGKIALFKGVFKSVSLVKQVKESLEKTLELDPEEPTAHYVMGRTHHKICEKPKIARKIMGLGWAEREIGLGEYRKAIELDSAFIMYRLDYARLLLEMTMREEGKRQLELIQQLPIRDEDDQRYKREAVELMKEHRL